MNEGVVSRKILFDGSDDGCAKATVQDFGGERMVLFEGHVYGQLNVRLSPSRFVDQGRLMVFSDTHTL